MCAAISHRVDPWSAASRGLVLRGTLESPLSRVLASGARPITAPEVELRFEAAIHARDPSAGRHGAHESGSGEQRGPGIHGRVVTRVATQCQRCLEEFEYSLVTEVHLRVIAAAEPDTAEDGISCAPGQTLDLAQLLEDEILLSLPFSPRCEFGSDVADAARRQRACEQRKWVVASGDSDLDAASPRAGTPAQDSRANPFEVLAGLKTGGGDAQNH